MGYAGTVRPLANTHNDGALIAARLGALQFGTVDHLRDPDETVFTQRLQAFMERVKPGDLAFLYYAGHGVQIRGVNYLLMENGRTFISMQSLIETLRGATDTIVLLLDACRTALDGAIPAREGRGLSVVSATEAELLLMPKGDGRDELGFELKAIAGGAPARRIGSFELRGTGIKIVFATDPQNVAADAAELGDRNSPFAFAIARRLGERRSLDDVISLATGDVVTATGGAQSPWAQGSIGRPIFLAGPPLNRNPAKVPFQVPG
nr:caspase family protein [Sphingobium boeckii]